MSEPLPRERFPAGYIVCNIGEAGDSGYVIESGSVEVMSSTDECIAIMGSGELFGEMSLLDDLPRTATIRTLTAATLLRIDRAHIQELLKRTDPVIRYLLTLLLERFRQRNLLQEAPQRLPVKAGGTLDESAATRTLMLAQELAHAIDNNGLELAYQPMVSFVNRDIVGFEALIRWHHPLLGTILPSNLIGLAEKTGLIHRVGQWVLKQACADWPELSQSCLRAGQKSPHLSVNLSAAELIKPDIVDTIRDQLEVARIAPQNLTIELTETLVIEDLEQVAKIMDKLAALGIGIALDDFGTGYAGLDYLRKLPISCLKIDRRFIMDPDMHPRGMEIAKTAIALAKTLGMTTIAEGIETPNVAEQLQGMGCDIAQGYFYGHPMPLKVAQQWITSGGRNRS